jgi:hypothetical protein
VCVCVCVYVTSKVSIYIIIFLLLTAILQYDLSVSPAINQGGKLIAGLCVGLELHKQCGEHGTMMSAVFTWLFGVRF